MALYIIRSGKSAFVKIERAENIARRLDILQAGNPEPLRLIRVLAGDAAEEAWFHRRYAHLRTRREWFRFCPTMLTAQPQPETVPVARRAQGQQGQTVVRFKRRATLGPASDLITRFGGHRKAAEIAGVAPVVACKWQHRGIPHKYWPAFQAAGVTVAELEACRPERMKSAA